MSEAEDTTSQTIRPRGAEPLTKREQMASAHEPPEPPVVPVEIRVHGVSGTPPEQMLVAPGIAHPAVRQVAGDAAAGFYVQDGTDESPVELEAYSWGGLTSGGKLRALWLLLVPFMLVNLAFWTASSPLGDPGGTRPTARTRRTLEAVLRLFALSLTAAFVLAFVVASMDIVGWQYIQQAGQLNIGWLAFLSWGPLNSPNVQLMLTALVPLVLILLLWHLGRSTWKRLESTTPPSVDPVEELSHPLEDRAMWNGERPVGHQRALHISFALALLGLFLVMPLLMDPGSKGFAALSTTWQRPWGWAALLLAAALATCGAVAVGMTCLPSLSDRQRPERPDKGEKHKQNPDKQDERNKQNKQNKPNKPNKQNKQNKQDKRDKHLWVALETVAAGLLVAAAALLLFPGPWQAVWPGATIGSLPGSVASVQILFVAQGLLALVVFLGAWRLRVLSLREHPIEPAARTEQPAARTEQPAVKADPAWHGLVPGFLTVIAWLLGGGLAAGLTLVVARLIGTPLSSAATSASLSTGSNAVVVPAPFIWAAVAILPVVVCAMVIAVATYAVIRLGSEAEVDKVHAAYAGTPVNPQAYGKRERWIAQGWARGSLIDKSVTPVGLLVVITGLIVLTGSVLYVRDPTWVTSQAGWVVTVAVLAMATVMLWLLQLVRRVYEDPGTRRQVGMIWDLGTFWPRAVHPLAPPCYAERAIPDLITRIEFHTGVVNRQPSEPSENRPVVLSCHSQGSVIGVATVLQLTYEGSARVALLTYGNPVRRLYSRFFPAYFGLDTMTRVGGLLSKDPAGPEDRASWRWRNLYRPTDPIGGPIFATAPPGPCDEDQVDWNLLDPAAAEPLPGDTCCPPALGHSDYFVDRDFTSAEELLDRELVRRWEPVAADRQRRA